MNRKKAAELLPIIQAFSEGQDIEYFDKGDCKWRTCIEPDFNDNVEYHHRQAEKGNVPRQVVGS